MMRRGDTGDEIDPLNVGIAKCAVYLVDWSATDADGEPVIIRGQSEEYITAALDNMDAEAFGEILRAVETHDNAMEIARAEEKKTRHGSRTLDPILPSPENSAGVMSGLPNYHAISMTP